MQIHPKNPTKGLKVVYWKPKCLKPENIQVLMPKLVTHKLRSLHNMHNNQL